MKKSPVLLAILDGWGSGAQTSTNAIYMAKTPNMDGWLGQYPHTTLIANGETVGLPAGQMGNSEVGHLNIGAGRVVYQDLTRINNAIATGEFLANKMLNAGFDKVLKHQKALHLMGLLSDGGVHSHIEHLLVLIESAAQKGVRDIYVHAFMDGRDTPPQSGLEYMRTLVDGMARIGVGRVATVTGRYYGMDRDNRWSRVEKAWQALVHGVGEYAADPLTAVEQAYERGETDEFIKPIVIADNQRAIGQIKDNDSVIFFNFRADRARELTHAFTDPDFNGFARGTCPNLGEYITFTSYDKAFTLPVAFPPTTLTNILGEIVSKNGLRQLRIAETEKYAHVTFFFNGGVEQPFANEDRVLIPSPKEVATYDLKPQMSAYELTAALEEKLAEDVYDLIILNFANGDMVGHSGKLAAAITACEAVDECLGRLVTKVQAAAGTVLITADHGNADIMADPQNGGPFTAHTTNPVPFITISNALKGRKLRDGGALKDIAPTILDLLSLPVPAEMEGVSLITIKN